jgi:hypothetical protein
VLKRGAQAILTEMYPAPDQLCVSGPEGHFYHELQVPFVRKPWKQASDSARPAPEKKNAYRLPKAGEELCVPAVSPAKNASEVIQLKALRAYLRSEDALFPEAEICH